LDSREILLKPKEVSMWFLKELDTYRRVHKKVATYISNLLIYIDLRIINFKVFIRRNFMNARSKQSDTKCVKDGKNVNLHGSLLVAVPF
jgi:hypothetical protein